MTDKQVQVYLDSSDFSRLSDPRRADPLTTSLLRKFRDFRQSGLVVFRFSMTHVCEIAPVDAGSQLAAERRAQLIYELCGPHTMVDMERLLRSEIILNEPAPFSDHGEWYPAPGGLIDELTHIRAKDAYEKAISNQHGLNRAARRRLKRTTIGKKGLKADAQKDLESNQPETIAELTRLYPMPDECANILFKYMLRKSTRAEAESALKGVLVDPRWLMRWFATKREVVTPLTDWLRKTAIENTATLTRNLSNAVSVLKDYEASYEKILLYAKSLDDSLAREYMMREIQKRDQQWRSDQKSALNKLSTSMIRNVFNRLGADFDTSFQEDESVAAIRKRSPGLSTMISTYFAIAKSAAQIQGRELTESDFADAVHAFYAPYVDLFRADSFVAPLVSAATKGMAVEIVGKLDLLPIAIDRKLRT